MDLQSRFAEHQRCRRVRRAYPRPARTPHNTNDSTGISRFINNIARLGTMNHTCKTPRCTRKVGNSLLKPAIPRAIQPLVLQAVEEAFHWRVITAIPLAATPQLSSDKNVWFMTKSEK